MEERVDHRAVASELRLLLLIETLSVVWRVGRWDILLLFQIDLLDIPMMIWRTGSHSRLDCHNQNHGDQDLRHIPVTVHRVKVEETEDQGHL